MNRINLIFEMYPQIVTIRDGVAFDAADNIVEYDDILIDAEIQRLSYKDKRRAEYPSIPDQLDTLYHGGYDAWKATIKAVKDKYPKE